MEALFRTFGPEYPDLGAKVARLRRGKDRHAHGIAVLDAILSKQRSELRRETPSHAIVCASCTSHTTGKDILKAVAQQHRNATMAYASSVRRARKPCEWQEMYDEAMKEKREREAEIAARPTAEIIKLKQRRPSSEKHSVRRRHVRA